MRLRALKRPLMCLRPVLLRLRYKNLDLPMLALCAVSIAENQHKPGITCFHW
jgi:hypothetical protein